MKGGISPRSLRNFTHPIASAWGIKAAVARANLHRNRLRHRKPKRFARPLVPNQHGANMEQEDCQPPNGAGWTQREPVSLDQVIDVLTLKTRSDPNGKEITHWANQLQEADLFADMDSQMLAAMLYAVMNSNCAYLSSVQEYVRFKVKCELEGL